MTDLTEILKLTRENSRLLKENNRILNQIVEYIIVKESDYYNENEEDLLRNVVANLVSSRIVEYR